MNATPNEPLLDRITSPHQLRRMNPEQLSALAEEMRQRIIDVVSKNGGHLASNLGLAELSIAMHYVFDFQQDRLLWDVGHQCYPHKLLTGRAGQFDSLRQAGGLSGFPSPTESPYDLFHTGHAGTAVSTAAGLAWADWKLQRDTKVVAVVGDASIVNGLSFEGLNNASLLKRQFLIILNDNSMAIDRTHGALAEALDRLRMAKQYNDLKSSTEQMLQRLPYGMEISDAIKHFKDGIRTNLHGMQIFEALGFNYFGPVDGHDIPGLIRTLKRLGDHPHPTVLHIHTEKGRGCQYAVENPCRFHSPSAHTISNGEPIFDEPKRPSWTQTFAETLIEAARKDDRIVAITAAMPDGTGLAKFREEFPDRTIDVGIGESHAAAMAAGLAKAGLRPVVAIYSTFMQRAFDQVFHEACLQNLPVIFCMDRAGLVGSDGAVHHGFCDISFLRPLPGITLCAPADGNELSAALQFALAGETPVAIRYPRDETPAPLPGDNEPFEPGRSRLVRNGTDATIFAYGAMVETAMRAAETLHGDGLDVAVIDARFAKPLDRDTILTRVKTTRPFLVVEDHAKVGGLGSAVLELLCEEGVSAERVRMLGLPDRFVHHASRQHQLKIVGLDSAGITKAVREMTTRRATTRTN
jgi:1-deoxy-D-xylulose-5-phosphate synthase